MHPGRAFEFESCAHCLASAEHRQGRAKSLGQRTHQNHLVVSNASAPQGATTLSSVWLLHRLRMAENPKRLGVVEHHQATHRLNTIQIRRHRSRRSAQWAISVSYDDGPFP